MFDTSRSLPSLRRLFADLEAIAETGTPSRADLANAPLLDRWTLAHIPARELCLQGASYGHPLLDGVARPVVTSRIVAMAPDMTWARTWSRFYRLGRPADDLQASGS